MQWPVKADEIKEFRGLDFKAVIEANERIGKPTISTRTVNKYLSATAEAREEFMARKSNEALGGRS